MCACTLQNINLNHITTNTHFNKKRGEISTYHFITYTKTQLDIDIFTIIQQKCVTYCILIEEK